jgi:hypothetical protein
MSTLAPPTTALNDYIRHRETQTQHLSRSLFTSYNHFGSERTGKGWKPSTEAIRCVHRLEPSWSEKDAVLQAANRTPIVGNGFSRVKMESPY